MRQERPALFKGRHFEAEIILLCVRRYLRYALSLRDLEEIMAERNVDVDHVTIWRDERGSWEGFPHPSQILCAASPFMTYSVYTMILSHFQSRRLCPKQPATINFRGMQDP